MNDEASAVVAGVAIAGSIILAAGSTMAVAVHAICADYIPNLTGLPLYTICTAAGIGTAIWVIRSPFFAGNPATEVPL